ncbi:hypothetical protein D3C87_123350 [compost metagenome]
MAHVLARLHGVKYRDIKRKLQEDAPANGAQGLYLEHIWRNEDDNEEVVFLLRTTDLKQARQWLLKVHMETLDQNPRAILPVMTFLQDNDSLFYERDRVLPDQLHLR